MVPGQGGRPPRLQRALVRLASPCVRFEKSPALALTGLQSELQRYRQPRRRHLLSPSPPRPAGPGIGLNIGRRRRQMVHRVLLDQATPFQAPLWRPDYPVEVGEVANRRGTSVVRSPSVACRTTAASSSATARRTGNASVSSGIGTTGLSAPKSNEMCARTAWRSPTGPGSQWIRRRDFLISERLNFASVVRPTLRWAMVGAFSTGRPVNVLSRRDRKRVKERSFCLFLA